MCKSASFFGILCLLKRIKESDASQLMFRCNTKLPKREPTKIRVSPVIMIG